jgi:hypothetical protein
MELNYEYKEYLIGLTKTIVRDNTEYFKENKKLYEKFTEEDKSIGFKEEFIESCGFLNEEGISNAEKIIDSILKRNNLLSKHTIKHHYLDILFDLLTCNKSDDEKIKKCIDLFLSNLHKSSGEIHIYFPIHGLELKDIDEIKMGPINLIPYATMMERTNEKIYTYFDSIEDTESRERIKSKIEGILPSFVSGVCAEVETRGDFFKSTELAENYARSIIDLLRIYLPIIYMPSDVNAIKIGIMDNDDFTMFNSFAVSMNYPYDVGYSEQWKGRRFNYILSKKKLELMKKNHLEEFLHTIIEGAASKSEFNARIFRAARWISMGVNEDEDSSSNNKILKLAVGLECLLINEKTCITEKLAERCALVQQLDFEERIKLYKKIIHFYDARSKIVHEGLGNIDSREVRDFQLIVIKTLLNVISLKEKYQWYDFEDLKSWIREQKFSTPVGA